MEFLNTIMSCGEDHFFGRTIDAQMFIHCIGTHDFRVKEHSFFESVQSKSLMNEQAMREEIEDGYIPWYNALSDAYVIHAWLQEDLFGWVEHYRLEFRNGGYVDFCTGEFHFVAPPGQSAKRAAIRILESYGYQGGDEIWRLMRHNNGLMVSLTSELFLAPGSEVQQIIDMMIADDTVRKENLALEEEFRRLRKDD